jgi:hypothetical protein
MPPFPRENRRSFGKRAANFAQGLFGRFRPKSLTNALNYGATENAKKNTTRRVPKVGFGPGGPIHSLNGEYVSPELEDSLKLTRNADIREQNRFRRVMALLDEKNFESFFGFSDMDVEPDPRDRHPPRVIVEDYERLLTTRKRYGNNSDESEDEIIEAYNDLLFMILQLLFFICKYILKNLVDEISSKIRNMENGIQRNKLIEIHDKIGKTIKEAERITQIERRAQLGADKDLVRIIIGVTVVLLVTTTIPLIGVGMDAAIVTMAASSGVFFPLILLQICGFLGYEKKLEDKRILRIHMYMKALHKLFQVVFNTENKFPFEMLKDERKIDWGIFNKSQIEFIIKRTPSKIVKKFDKEDDKEDDCPICMKCINKENYYDMDSPKTKEEIKNINKLSEDAYLERYIECKEIPAEQLFCGHRYHTWCINSWIKSEESSGRVANCPICRAPIYKHSDFDYAGKSFDLNPSSPINIKLTVSVRANAALKQGTDGDGMTEIMFFTFLSHLLNLYYEPDRFRVFNSPVSIEELGESPNKPLPIARPFTHKPKSANNGVCLQKMVS